MVSVNLDDYRCVRCGGIFDEAELDGDGYCDHCVQVLSWQGEDRDVGL